MAKGMLTPPLLPLAALPVVWCPSALAAAWKLFSCCRKSPVEAYLDQLLLEVRQEATAAGFKPRVSGWGESTGERAFGVDTFTAGR